MGSAESGTQPAIDSFSLLIDNQDNNQQKNGQNIRQMVHQKLLASVIKQKQKQRKFKPTINFIDLQEFENLFIESGNNIEKFFELVQGRISDLYISLSKQTLQFMCQKKLRPTQSKIYISQQVLYMSMNILKILGVKTNFKYDAAIVNKLNSLQLFMLGYMKVKYPRQNQNFIPGQLMQEFKNFDFVQQPENDILKEIKICFWDDSQNKIIRKIKKLINSLIEEVDNKFSDFQQLLSQKVFKVTKQGRQYSVQNKIGRKIPQGAQRFNQQQQTSIDLKSPEVFRVMIKWVNDMQSYILQPEDQIKQKDHFKTAYLNDDQFSFDYVTVDEINNSLYVMQSLLQTCKNQYQDQLKQLKNQIQLFNHNLIKILIKGQRKQRYVPKRQAQIIKYSMFNKKLLSWMMIEKLKIVLKKLIQVSIKLQQSIGYRLDLIKFNVTDLLRAMMVGNKYQIMKVFSNLKNLQNSKLIKILKIKNRLETPLNDVMVIFKMSSSFIICQLQLIMSDSHQTTNDKLKNIQILNHFFYQIQRSPYGVMAELAALLSFKDTKTSFQQKITFLKIPQFDIDNSCMENHPASVQQQKYQKNPFICSLCTQFYSEYQNHHIYKYCKECNQYKCAKCILLNNKQQQYKYQQLTMKQKITKLANVLALKQQSLMKQQTNQKTQNIEYISNKNNMYLLEKALTMKTKAIREIAKKKNKVTYQQLQKFVLQNNTPTADSNYYFSIAKFVGKQIQLFSMKKQGLNPIKQCFKNRNTQSTIQYNYFDFLIIFTQAKPQVFTNQVFQPENLNLFKNFNRPNNSQKKYEIIHISVINSPVAICNVMIIFDIRLIKNAQRYYGEQKKQFQYESIEQLRKNLPNLLQTYQVINISNQGIVDKHLTYFTQTDWKTKMKSINLHQNKIGDITVLLAQLPSLEKLIVSCNFLQKIEFKVKLPNFKKLIAFKNSIAQVLSIQNVPNIQIINLQQNQLRELLINHLKFPQLRILNLDNNIIYNFQNLSDACCPLLAKLNIYGNSQWIDGNLNLSSLTNLSLLYFNFRRLEIESSKYLQTLKLQQTQLKSLKLTDISHLKKLKISFGEAYQMEDYGCGEYNQEGQEDQEGQQQEENQDANENQQTLNQNNQQKPPVQQKDNTKIQLLNQYFPQLTELYYSFNQNVESLPILNMPRLKKLQIYFIKITNYSNLSEAKLQSLQFLKFESVSNIMQLPILKCPNLKQIHINTQSLFNLTNIKNWETPKLQILYLSSIFQSTQIPGLNHLNLKQLNIVGGKFAISDQFEIKSLITLELIEVDFQNFIGLDLPNLQTMKLTSCPHVNFKILQTMKIENVQSIQLENLIQNLQSIKVIPILNLKTLQRLSITGCFIEDVSNLAFSNLPKLKKLQLQSNNIKKLPTLTFSNLQFLNVQTCEITDLIQFQLSELPLLKKIIMTNNRIQQLPILKMKNLQQANFSNCYLQSIDNLSQSQLPKLQILNLLGQKNIIKSLAKLNLPKLKKLQIAITSLSNLDNLTHSNLNSLQVLDLSNMKLDTPVLPVINLQNVCVLNIVSSNIIDIHNLQYSMLPHLQQLTLNFSEITIFPIIKFDLLNQINYINSQQYKNNKKTLQSVQNLKYCILPNIQKITINFNKIKSLPQMNFPKLKYLYVTNNQITNLTQFKKSTLPSIEKINIYDNPIQQLPIGKSVKPSALYMKGGFVKNFNQLAEYANIFTHFYYNYGTIPENTKWQKFHFRNVKIFQIIACCLVDVDGIFKNSFDQCVQLAINDNQVVKLPKIIAPALKKLYLNRNNIKDVTQFIKSDLKQTQMISLETNQIQNLPDFPFMNTKQIFLSHNLVTDISFISKYVCSGLVMMVFYDLKIEKLGKLNAPILQKIYFNQNCINSLQPMKGSHLPNCKKFQLSDNKITDLNPLNFMSLNNLQEIYLMGNKLQKLCHLNLFKLQKLNISNNPLKNVDDFVKKKLNLYGFYYSVNGDADMKLKIKNQLSPFYQGLMYQYNYGQSQ